MKYITLIILAAFISGCTGGGAQTENLPLPRDAFPTRAAALDMIYSTSYTVPANFFVDARADTPRSYSAYHVKAQAILKEDTYELCADNIDEAIALEEVDNARRFINGVFVEAIETEKYFEIVRELNVAASTGNTGMTEPGFARVFKCGYVNRDGVDRTDLNGYGGTFNAVLTQASAREFTQYMWQWKFFWPTTAKVLDTYSEESATEVKHRLVLGVRSNQSGDCDLIQVVDWIWIYNKSTGEILRRVEAIDRFNAKIENGAPIVCPAT